MAKRTKNGTSVDDAIFHLLHRASQRADEIFDEEVDEVGLTARQFAVLLAVSRSEDPSQTALVECTGIDRSTVAEMIRRMVGKRLLQRRRSRQDARAYVVRLTDRGREILKSAEPKAQRADTALLERLSAEQRKALVEALEIVGVEE